MMGKDCERMLRGINSVKDSLSDQINRLSSMVTGRMVIEYKGGSIHSSNDSVSFDPIKEVQEVEDIIETESFISAINKAMSGLSGDIGKMNSLESGMYTSSNTFNNSYGSPWKELNMLNNAVSKVLNYGSSNPQLKFIGQKIVLLNLMNTALSYAVDAKWALVIYHDYIQRGYDYKFNGKTSSVLHKKGLDKLTIGNISQDFTENVNLPKSSIDPF